MGGWERRGSAQEFRFQGPPESADPKMTSFTLRPTGRRAVVDKEISRIRYQISQIPDSSEISYNAYQLRSWGRHQLRGVQSPGLWWVGLLVLDPQHLPTEDWEYWLCHSGPGSRYPQISARTLLAEVNTFAMTSFRPTNLKSPSPPPPPPSPPRHIAPRPSAKIQRRHEVCVLRSCVRHRCRLTHSPLAKRRQGSESLGA